jgi:hypothetical protein
MLLASREARRNKLQGKGAGQGVAVEAKPHALARPRALGHSRRDESGRIVLAVVIEALVAHPGRILGVGPVDVAEHERRLALQPKTSAWMLNWVWAS